MTFIDFCCCFVRFHFFPDLWYKKHTHTNSVPDDLPFFFRFLFRTNIHYARDHYFELIVFLAYICICRWSRNKLLMNVARDGGIHLVNFIHWWKCVEAFRIYTKAGSGEWYFFFGLSGLIDILFFLLWTLNYCGFIAFHHFSMQAPYLNTFFCLFENFLLLQFCTNFNLSLLVIFNLPQTRSLSTHTRNCSPHSAKHFSFSLFFFSLSFFQFRSFSSMNAIIIEFHCGQRPFPWHIIRSPTEPLLDFTIFFSMSLPSSIPKLFHSFFFLLCFVFVETLQRALANSVMSRK